MTNIMRRESLARALGWMGEALRFHEVLSVGRILIEHDEWHRVGDPGEPAFSGALYGAPDDDDRVQFRALSNGFVQFRGKVKGLTGLPPNGVICTMPEDYWPPYAMWMSVPGFGRTASGQPYDRAVWAVCEVRQDGVFYVRRATLMDGGAIHSAELHFESATYYGNLS